MGKAQLPAIRKLKEPENVNNDKDSTFRDVGDVLLSL